jgi:hypothetical protein
MPDYQVTLKSDARITHIRELNVSYIWLNTYSMSNDLVLGKLYQQVSTHSRHYYWSINAEFESNTCDAYVSIMSYTSYDRSNRWYFWTTITKTL